MEESKLSEKGMRSIPGWENLNFNDIEVGEKIGGGNCYIRIRVKYYSVVCVL